MNTNNPDNQITRFEWTEAAIEQLSTLAATGHTASMIAAIFGTTRNSVVGKCHRAGIKLPGLAPKAQRAKSEPKPKVAAPRPQKPVSKPKPAAVRPAAPVLRVIVCEPGPVDGVAFLDLQRHHCRWPLGGPKEPALAFCGAQKLDGKPNCATHAALAYVARPKSNSPKPFNFTALPIRPRLHVVAAE